MGKTLDEFSKELEQHIIDALNLEGYKKDYPIYVRIGHYEGLKSLLASIIYLSCRAVDDDPIREKAFGLLEITKKNTISNLSKIAMYFDETFDEKMESEGKNG